MYLKQSSRAGHESLWKVGWRWKGKNSRAMKWDQKFQFKTKENFQTVTTIQKWTDLMWFYEHLIPNASILKAQSINVTQKWDRSVTDTVYIQKRIVHVEYISVGKLVRDGKTDW